MEVLIHPFSFREALRHVGAEPVQPYSAWPKAQRTVVDSRLREYLTVGGFPEAQGVPVRDRMDLLRTYVDVAILRDVIERVSTHPMSRIGELTPRQWRQLRETPTSGPAAA